MKQWLQSGILKYVDQIGIEMHTGAEYVKKSWTKFTFNALLTFIKTARETYGFEIAAYEPNLKCAKSQDNQKMYYSLHDILFVKKMP